MTPLVFPARLLAAGNGTVGLAEYLLERLTERLILQSFLFEVGSPDEAAIATALRRVRPELQKRLGAAQEGSVLQLRDDELRALRLVAVPPAPPPAGAHWSLADTLRPLFSTPAKKAKR